MKENKSDQFIYLRKRAEEVRQKLNGSLNTIPSSDMRHLIEELQIHQIELELQNEELCKTQKLLKASEERLSAIIQNTPALMAIKDLTGKYIMVNRPFEELIGKKEVEIFGKCDIEIFGDDIGIMLRANDQKVLNSQKPMKFEEEIIGKNGARNFISVKFPLLEQSGEIYALCTISTDITEEKIRDKHVTESEKFAALGTLAAGVAHEFKNFLASIIGNATFAMNFTYGNEELTSCLQSITVAGEEAARIASTLLSYSRRETEAFGFHNLEELIISTEKIIEKSLKDDNIKIVADIKSQNPVYMCPGQIQQVILNLLMNAREAIGTQGGEIRIKSMVKDNYIWVEISDTGTGFPEENLNKIFDPFFSTKGVWGDDNGKGTGLGLTWAKNIIHKHNGKIEAKNNEDGGSCVTFGLPMNIEVDSLKTISPIINAGAPVIIFSMDNSINEKLRGQNTPKKSVNYVVDNYNSLCKRLSGMEEAVVIFDARFPGQSELIKSIRYCKNSKPSLKLLIINRADSGNDMIEELISENMIFESAPIF